VCVCVCVCVCVYIYIYIYIYISCRKYFLTNELGDVHVQWTRKAWGPSDVLRKKFY